MINIKYEIYHNDFNRRYEDKSFASMSDFKEWMFGLMNRPYVDADGHKNMWFVDSIVNYNKTLDSSCRIDIRPEWGGVSYWIYCVSDNNSIVFSNGKYTNGQCYISEGFKAFLKECQDRRDGKEQTFVFGEVDGFKPDEVKSYAEQAAEFIKKNPEVAREIHFLIDKECRESRTVDDVLSNATLRSRDAVSEKNDVDYDIVKE